VQLYSVIRRNCRYIENTLCWLLQKSFTTNVYTIAVVSEKLKMGRRQKKKGKTQRKRKRGGRAVGGKEAAIAGRKRNSKGEKYNEKVECADHRDQGMKM
jgi:hypothetical protein